jgi:hypothetical protein
MKFDDTKRVDIGLEKPEALRRNHPKAQQGILPLILHELLRCGDE